MVKLMKNIRLIKNVIIYKVKQRRRVQKILNMRSIKTFSSYSLLSFLFIILVFRTKIRSHYLINQKSKVCRALFNRSLQQLLQHTELIQNRSLIKYKLATEGPKPKSTQGWLNRWLDRPNRQLDRPKSGLGLFAAAF